MSLKSKIVSVDGIGEVEFREPLFDEVAPLLSMEDQRNLGVAVLKLCTWVDGKRLFDGPVGVSVGMAVMKHVQDALEVCGMVDEKKADGQ
jgi:hypothetical protein